MLDKLYNKKILNAILLSLLGLTALSVVVWLVLDMVLGIPGEYGAGLLLILTYVYLVITAVAAVGMTAMNMNKGRGDNKLGLYVFGSVVVLAIVFYFAGSAKPVIGADGTVFDSKFELKSTDMMLLLAYVALGVVVATLLAGEVWSAVKNSSRK